MKTVPFSDILASVCQIIGLDRTTLNDKAFGAIRDITARRIGTIWDREEWPDQIRSINTWVGTPVQSVVTNFPFLLQENENEILLENGLSLYADEDDMIKVTLFFDTTFQRTWLIDFTENLYQKGTIGVADTITISNPFFFTLSDGSKLAASGAYNYTYTTQSGNNGLYIDSVSVLVPFGYESDYNSYLGANSAFTSKVVFSNNQNLLIRLDESALQGLQVYSADPSSTTRAVPETFTVEDYDYIDDTDTTGYVVQKEYTYLKFITNSKKFVNYRQPAIRLFGFGWESNTSYSPDSQVFFDPVQNTALYNPLNKTKSVRGDFWNCISSSSVPLNVSPSYSSAYWEMAQIPYRFRDYLVNGVSADFLKSEGRAEEAAVFDNFAEMAVQQQIDVLLRQQGQVQKMNMVYTY